MHRSAHLFTRLRALFLFGILVAPLSGLARSSVTLSEPFSVDLREVLYEGTAIVRTDIFELDILTTDYREVLTATTQTFTLDLRTPATGFIGFLGPFQSQSGDLFRLHVARIDGGTTPPALYDYRLVDRLQSIRLFEEREDGLYEVTAYEMMDRGLVVELLDAVARPTYRNLHPGYERLTLANGTQSLIPPLSLGGFAWKTQWRLNHSQRRNSYEAALRRMITMWDSPTSVRLSSMWEGGEEVMVPELPHGVMSSLNRLLGQGIQWADAAGHVETLGSASQWIERGLKGVALLDKLGFLKELRDAGFPIPDDKSVSYEEFAELGDWFSAGSTVADLGSRILGEAYLRYVLSNAIESERRIELIETAITGANARGFQPDAELINALNAVKAEAAQDLDMLRTLGRAMFTEVLSVDGILDVLSILKDTIGVKGVFGILAKTQTGMAGISENARAEGQLPLTEAQMDVLGEIIDTVVSVGKSLSQKNKIRGELAANLLLHALMNQSNADRSLHLSSAVNVGDSLNLSALAEASDAFGMQTYLTQRLALGMLAESGVTVSDFGGDLVSFAISAPAAAKTLGLAWVGPGTSLLDNLVRAVSAGFWRDANREVEVLFYQSDADLSLWLADQERAFEILTGGVTSATPPREPRFQWAWGPSGLHGSAGETLRFFMPVTAAVDAVLEYSVVSHTEGIFPFVSSGGEINVEIPVGTIPGLYFVEVECTATGHGRISRQVAINVIDPEAGTGSIQVIAQLPENVMPMGFQSEEVFQPLGGEPPLQWRLMGDTEWRDSGDTVTELPVGFYEVEWEFVEGIVRPQRQWIEVTADATVTLSESYADLTPMGVPPSWLDGHGLTRWDYDVEEWIDHDGDGMMAWEEFYADTDPRDPASRLLATAITTGAELRIYVQPISPQRVYTVLVNSTLSENGWTPVTGLERILGNPDDSGFIVPISDSGPKFYRIQVDLPNHQ